MWKGIEEKNILKPPRSQKTEPRRLVALIEQHSYQSEEETSMLFTELLNFSTMPCISHFRKEGEVSVLFSFFLSKAALAQGIGRQDTGK